MFLLFGDNDLSNGALGGECHRRLVALELSLRRLRRAQVLRKLYGSRVQHNLGRTIVALATKD